ncbi:MAG: hypothetical protein CM15mP106_0080 [Candidatus Neomarinimicrobiota bacterium]|nr:MAG: hypothetical protein CM15mP106_0080 [Candidatus Neomarinimicrobiota bacterium]
MELQFLIPINPVSVNPQGIHLGQDVIVISKNRKKPARGSQRVSLFFLLISVIYGLSTEKKGGTDADGQIRKLCFLEKFSILMISFLLIFSA